MKNQLNNFIKTIITDDKTKFQKICSANGLSLDYETNKSSLSILEAIFFNREYADYFPFYTAATVVDIGAHFGYFSIFAHQHLAKDSMIYAVEAHDQNFNVLVNNIKACHIDNINTFNVALGGENKIGRLYAGQSHNVSIIEDYPLSSGNSFSEINVIKLDDFIDANNLQKIDFLKLDCEGAEYDILFNASSSAMEKIITISMEFHDLKDVNRTGQKLVNKLSGFGFQIVKYQYAPSTLNLNYGKIIATRMG